MLADGEYLLDAGGVEHWIRVAGAANGGVPLVHVHGGPGGNARAVERSVGERLAEQHTVIFYDQRGCGRSRLPADPASYTFERLVADLEELRAGLELEQIVPWGVSFGCVVAAEYTVAHPDRVERLVLHAPPIAGPLHPGVWALRPATVDAIAGSGTRAKLRAAMHGLTDPVGRVWATSEILDADPDSAARFLYHDPRRARAHATGAAGGPAVPDLSVNPRMARALVGTERADLADELARLDRPTLVLIGLWDRHVGVDIARNLADRLPHGRLEVFGHSAHLPDEEEPVAYVAAIRNFLRG